MAEPTLQQMTAEIAELMRGRLGVRRGTGLEAKLRRAGRLLPRKVRRAAWALAEAERRAAHPKLMRQVDMAAMKAAHARVKAHLETIDPADRRWGTLLGILAPLAFNLLAIFAALVAWLSWSGRI